MDPISKGTTYKSAIARQATLIDTQQTNCNIDFEHFQEIILHSNILILERNIGQMIILDSFILSAT